MKTKIWKKFILWNSLFLGLLGEKMMAQNAQMDSNLNVSNPVTFHQVQHPFKLPIDKQSVRGSYPLAVSDVKTVHLLFPAKIREVDTGTPNLLVQITESFDNVLRVKSINMPEKQETNLTVLTEDGALYSFITTYAKDPELLNIQMQPSQPSLSFMEDALGQSLAEIQSNASKVLETRNFVKNIGLKSQGLKLELRAIQNSKSVQYLKLELQNDSELPYQLDFAKLYLKDQPGLQKTAIQQEELKVILLQPARLEVFGKSSNTLVICTLLKSIPSEKSLEIELFEKEGGRNLRFEIDSNTLIKSKKL